MKNIIIFALIGVSFLLSGFWYGMRLAPMPKKPASAAAVAKAAPAPREAFTLDTLRQTSQDLVSVNQALQAREQSVAAREKAVGRQEEELTAERAALDQVHSHFKELYGEFQQKLQLVEDSETEQLQRQVTIFNAMDPTQSADLIRALDDGTVVRLFSLMDTKPLSKLVSAWKTKYPADAPRLLTALNGMGRVVAKDKIVLPDNPPAMDPNAGGSDSNSSAPALDATSSGQSTDASSGTATPSSPDGSAPAPAPAPSPYANAGTPPPDITGPSAAANAPATDASGSDANSTATPPDANAPAAPAAPADANAPAAASDASTPATPPAPTDANTPATPASPDTAPAPATAPSSDAAPAPQAAPAPAAPAPATSPAAASLTPDSGSLDTPGETAAKAALPNSPAAEETDPSDSTPPPAPMRLAHDKPARFAALRSN